MPQLPNSPKRLSLDGEVLLIRADASARIGMGHVMRCIGIADEWMKLGGKIVFVSRELPEELGGVLEAKGFQIVRHEHPVGSGDDAARTVAVGQTMQSKWIVIDGDGFGRDYFLEIRGAGNRVLVMDDNVAKPWYEADVVVNQSIWARAETYAGIVPRETAVLAGATYALLRPELRRTTPAVEPAGLASHVLLCMGGSDPVNRTSEVLRLLGALEDERVAKLEIRVIVGSANPFGEEVRAEAKQSGLNASIESGNFDLTAALGWADTVICAAGVFSLEVLHHRIPMAVTTVADNQNQNYPAICGRGAGLPLGAGAEFGQELTQTNLARLLFDPATRAKLFAASEGVVDGLGAGRVAGFMAENSLN